MCRTYTARHRVKYPLRTQLRASARYAKQYGVANTLTEAEWVAVLEDYGYACAYCLGPGSIIEHVVPMKSGGPNSKENVVPGCQPCNIAKASNVQALVPHLGSRFWPPSEAMLRV